MRQMVNLSYPQERAQISAKSTLMAVAATSRARQIVRRLLDGLTANESQVARRRMGIASHAMIPDSGATNVKTSVLKAVRTNNATKQMESAQVVAKTASLEKSATNSARVGAKVVVATKRTGNATMVARLAGVATIVMKLAQKALVLKDVIAKLDSQYRAYLAVIHSKAFFKTGGSARVAQTIVRTTNVTMMANAQKDAKSDFMEANACRIAVLIALERATSVLLVRKMDIARNVTLVSQVVLAAKNVTQHANRATNSRVDCSQAMVPQEKGTALSAKRTNRSSGTMGSASASRVLPATQPTKSVIAMNLREQKRLTRWRVLSSGHVRLAASFAKMACGRCSAMRSLLA